MQQEIKMLFVFLLLSMCSSFVQCKDGSLRAAARTSGVMDKNEHLQEKGTLSHADVELVHEQHHDEHHRDLESYYYDPDENACGITGFSIYNKTSNQWRPLIEMYFGTVPKAHILLETYPSQQINIMVHTSNAGCPTRNFGCVRMQLGNFYVREAKTAPFTLYYTDVNALVESVQRPLEVDDYYPLQVWVYDGNNCWGTPICSENIFLNLVSKRTETTWSQGITVTFQGATARPRNSADTREMFNATCTYVRMAISENLLGGNRSSLFLDHTNFQCTNLWTNTLWLPLKIMYSFVGTFSYGPTISAFNNPIIPKSDALTNYIRSVFRNQVQIDIGSGNETMSQYVKRVVSPSNPYWSHTGTFVL